MFYLCVDKRTHTFCYKNRDAIHFFFGAIGQDLGVVREFLLELLFRLIGDLGTDALLSLLLELDLFLLKLSAHGCLGF